VGLPPRLQVRQARRLHRLLRPTVRQYANPPARRLDLLLPPLIPRTGGAHVSLSSSTPAQHRATALSL
jgi:hypothetical protein